MAVRIPPHLNSLVDITTLLNIAESAIEIIDNSPLPQALYNKDKILVYANEKYCALNGRPLKDIVNRSENDHYIGNYRTDYDQFFIDIQQYTEASFHSEKRHGNGQIFSVEEHGSLINYHGKLHFLVSSKDVTASRRLTSSLQSSLDVQHAVMEASDDGMLVEDVDRTIIAINQNFFNEFNITPELLSSTNKPNNQSFQSWDACCVKR